MLSRLVCLSMIDSKAKWALIDPVMKTGADNESHSQSITILCEDREIGSWPCFKLAAELLRSEVERKSFPVRHSGYCKSYAGGAFDRGIQWDNSSAYNPDSDGPIRNGKAR